MPLLPKCSARHLALVAQILLGCSALATTESPGAVAGPRRTQPATLAPVATHKVPYAQALAQLASARYPSAEASLQRLIAEDPESRDRAEVSLAQLCLLTGRREQALELASKHCRASTPERFDACQIAGECLRRRGELKEAISLVQPPSEYPEARRLRLFFADLLREHGLTSEARLLYQRLVRDYNEEKFNRASARELAVTGRAAHRLGAFRDANEFFNLAEQTGVTEIETLLFRGELYLDAHDPNHAREVADEALKYAPGNPDAQLLFARVRLAESRDTSAAERYVSSALSVDPTRADGYYVLAGLSLRDLDFDAAHRYIDQGLQFEPKHLDLMSLRAAAEFLADETSAFSQTVSQVLSQNPDHARLFRVIAEYAEAEHRYADTIPLLRRAIALDPNDSQVHAHLGIQLIRAGEKSEGRRELLRAFTQDPFDLRVRNTLLLYDRVLDPSYVELSHPPFRILVPQNYSKPLENLIPSWLGAAKREYDKRYGPLEKNALDVELFADQDSFGVRTSGVPTSFLQGVCFGRTIVARLPTDEPVNLGMTLYHELSHVYHLQLSKHRVPRWFTEGLAEVETKRARHEWAREEEFRVYLAFRNQKIPKILEMNHAFSHATSLDDLAVAYVAATYLVEYLIDHYGFSKIPKLLKQWGQGTPTAKVLSSVLGTPVGQLDEGFQGYLEARFARLASQYIPPRRNESIPKLTELLAKFPSDFATAAALAEALLRQGNLTQCKAILGPLSTGPIHPDLLWVQSLLDLAESKYAESLQGLDRMVRLGYDGYFMRAQRALVYQMMGALADETRELRLACTHNPQATEPVYRLLSLARKSDDKANEIRHLDTLCALEEADASLHARRVTLNLELGRVQQAWLAAESLSYVAPLQSDARLLIMRTALAKNDHRRAAKEFDLARQLADSVPQRERVERLGQQAGLSPRNPADAKKHKDSNPQP